MGTQRINPCQMDVPLSSYAGYADTPMMRQRERAEICKGCGAKLDVLHEIELDDPAASEFTLIGRADRELRDVYPRESQQRLSPDAAKERTEHGHLAVPKETYANST